MFYTIYLINSADLPVLIVTDINQDAKNGGFATDISLTPEKVDCCLKDKGNLQVVGVKAGGDLRVGLQPSSAAQ